MSSEPYRREVLVPFVSIVHPLARKRVVTVAELLRSPLIIRGSGKNGATITEKMLNRLDPTTTPNIVMRADSPCAVKSAVTEGMGVGLLFGDLVYSDFKEGRLRPLKVRDSDLSVTVFLVHHREKPLSPNGRDFVKLLRDWQRKDRHALDS